METGGLLAPSFPTQNLGCYNPHLGSTKGRKELRPPRLLKGNAIGPQAILPQLSRAGTANISHRGTDAGHTVFVSVETTQLCLCSRKAATLIM